MKALKTIWIYGWAYLFVALELLDKLAGRVGNAFDKLVSKNWFVAALTVVNVWLVCKLTGWL